MSMRCSSKIGSMFGPSVTAVAIFMAIMVALAAWPGVGLAADKLTCAQQEAKAVVHAAALGLGALIKDAPDKDARIDLIRKFIEPVRFYPDNSGYFYVYDMDCVCIAHATQKELLGTSLKERRDPKGTYIVQELAEAAKKGGGFVEFYWYKPGVQGQHRKIGYAELIPGTNYLIGSGVYTED